MNSTEAKNNSNEFLDSNECMHSLENVLYEIEGNSKCGSFFITKSALSISVLISLIDLGFTISKKLNEQNNPYYIITW